MSMILMDRDSFRVLYQVIKNGPLLQTDITNKLKISQLISNGYLTRVAMVDDFNRLAASPSGADAFRRFVGESIMSEALRRFELTEPNNS